MSKTEVDYDDIASAIIKVIGKNSESTTISRWISTGFQPLDQALTAMAEGGGLPSGRIVEIAGPPSAGKTWLATQVMIAAQQAGGIAAFHDHERSFDSRLAGKLGLDLSPSRFIFKQPRTFEDSVATFMYAAQAIRGTKSGKKIPLVWVFDSLASMIPQSQLIDAKGNARDATKHNMNDSTALSRATSNHFKVLALLAEECDVLLIFLNQTRTKPGVVYGDPTTTPGGDSPKFYASVRIMLSAKQISKGEGEAKEVIGSQVKAVIIKNKTSRPFTKTTWKFMFNDDGTGYFDTIGSLLDLILAKGILNKAHGGRVEWPDGTKPFYNDLVKKLTDAGPAGVKVLEKMLIAAGVDADHDAEAETLAGTELVTEDT